MDTLRRQVWLYRDLIRDRFLGTKHRRAVFQRIHAENLWGDARSVSGSGSSPIGSAALRAQLPELFRAYGVRTVLDAPCGDFAWMCELVGHVDRYTGLDIVPELVAGNAARYGRSHVSFACADITADPLPVADLIICRDCFIHLPTRLIWRALENFCASGSRLVLLTSDANAGPYSDIAVGSFRPINLQAAPFCLPEPLARIEENADGRSLCLWDVDTLRQQIARREGKVPATAPGTLHGPTA